MVEALQRPLRSAIRNACQNASQQRQPALAITAASVPRMNLLSAFARYSPHMNANLWFGLTKKSILGLGAAIECTGHGADRFTDVSTMWHDLIKNAVTEGDTAPVALGGFRFDTACPASPMWAGFADGALVIPRVTILQNGAEYCRIVAADYAPPGADADARIRNICSGFNIGENERNMPPPEQEGHISIFDSGNARKQWQNLVHNALDAISRGLAKKIVAARMIRATSTTPFAVPNIVKRLHAKNPKATVFAFGRCGTYFVGATPEILITAKERSFQTMALAGSAPRSGDPARDAELGQALLVSDKDRIEHDFVVQAVLRSLQPHCETLVADSAPSLHKLHKVQHLVTHFKGNLSSGQNLLDIVAHLHPTPAVGGAPTEFALAFLREYESIDRGWYAGPVGWLDAENNGEFMVALRSGVICGENAALFAGCGLVANSDPDMEYQETRFKFSTMLDGLCLTHGDGE